MGGVGAALLVCACAWDAPPANVEGGGPGVNAEAPGGGLDAPVQGVVRSQLRDTYAESRGDHAHGALDILAERGTPVLSATDGRVFRLFDSEAGGLMVYAADPPGTPHLHFAILRGDPDVSWSRGTPVNPYRLLVPDEAIGSSLQLRL